MKSAFTHSQIYNTLQIFGTYHNVLMDMTMFKATTHAYKLLFDMYSATIFKIIFLFVHFYLR